MGNSIFMPKGMRQDESNAAFNSEEYAYENWNVRIAPTENGLGYSITNEKGNKRVKLISEDDKLEILILGTIIGLSTINNYWVLFTTDNYQNNQTDRIYRINKKDEDNELYCKVLYEGNLNFSLDYPIETLPFYENESIQKVYWIDGKNGPRLINIVDPSITNDSFFDFVPEMNLKEKVTIERTLTITGLWKPGTVQFALSYINKYGTESNIFYISPLYYISDHNSAMGPDESASLGFKITVEDIDENWEQVRLYSIHRSLADSTPEVKIVGESGLSKFIEFHYDWIDGAIVKYDLLSRISDLEILNQIKLSVCSDSGNPSTVIQKLNKNNGVWENINTKPDTTEYTEEYLYALNQFNSNITLSDLLYAKVGPSSNYNYSQLTYIKDSTNEDANTLNTQVKHRVIGTISNFDSMSQKVRQETITDIKTGNEVTINKYCSGELGTLFGKDGYGNIYDYDPITGEDSNYYTEKELEYLGTIGKYRIREYGRYQSSLLQSIEFPNGLKYYYLEKLKNHYVLVRSAIVNNTLYVYIIADDAKASQEALPYSFDLSNDYEGVDLSKKMLITPNLNYGNYNDYGTNNNYIKNIEQDTINSDFYKIPNDNGEDITSSSFLYSKVEENIKSKVLLIANNLTGELVDPTTVLFVGGELVIPKTIAQKDNTLFLGNITLRREEFDNSILDQIRALKVSFDSSTTKEIKNYDYLQSGYPYNLHFLLTNSSYDVTCYKYLEYYRFGLLFLHKTGKWSEPLFINDFINNYKPTVDNNDSTITKVAVPYTTIDTSNLWILNIIKLGYCKVRPVVVFPTLYERSVLCQGIISPTVYNALRRNDKSIYALSSWFVRNNGYVHNQFVDSDGGQGANYYMSNGEIQHNVGHGHRPDILFGYRNSSYNEELFKPTTKDLHLFMIDRQILTLHSPEIEFDERLKSIDIKETNFRIIGYADLRYNIGNMYLESGSPNVLYTKDTNGNFGYYGELSEGYTDGTLMFNNSNTALLKNRIWRDTPSGLKEGLDSSLNGIINTGQRDFIIFPWHRNGSLNNDVNTEEGSPTAILKNKVLSNLRYSPNTIYFDLEEHINPTINPPALYYLEDSLPITLEVSNPLLDKPVLYYGNVDIAIPTEILYWVFPNASYQNSIYEDNFNTTRGEDGKPLLYLRANTAIEMRYKSTPHAVVRLLSGSIGTSTGGNLYLRLHYLGSGRGLNGYPSINWGGTNDLKAFWDSNIKEASVVTNNVPVPNSSVYIGELYRNIDEDTLFGGKTEYALLNNKWYPAGPSIDIRDSNSTINIKWLEGDTYFLRYDHLKTYPFSNSDLNSIVEIFSFMCESRINLDGRYDNNRGLTDNTAISNINFNILNSAYTQLDDYFSYRRLSSMERELNTFSNQITWTKTKVLGAKTDNWTNITMANTLDFDGELGLILAIRNWNDHLIVFLDKGIAEIKYNNDILISTDNYVPIEIANSGKVTGSIYISKTMGTTNKWSIVITPSGLYFIDGINKSILVWSGLEAPKNISYIGGMHSWSKKNIDTKLWAPNKLSTFVSLFDSNNNEVLFTSSDWCLSYNEALLTFTSFYNYEGTSYITQLRDSHYMIKNNSIYQHNAGEYGQYYDNKKPFSVEVLVNKDPYIDKIFNTVEFISDSWNNGLLIDSAISHLKAYNEYQEGEHYLLQGRGLATLKKKFRTYKTFIPRNKSNGRDRLRNTWLKVKLSNVGKEEFKTVLHNIIVYYT